MEWSVSPEVVISVPLSVASGRPTRLSLQIDLPRNPHFVADGFDRGCRVIVD
jgi:hypothetical protein